jgi:hypothetical protein
MYIWVCMYIHTRVSLSSHVTQVCMYTYTGIADSLHRENTVIRGGVPVYIGVYVYIYTGIA